MEKIKYYLAYGTFIVLALSFACTTEEPTETDQDKDGYVLSEDCDDTNAQINPGAEEIKDNIDNNCNGQIDEGFDETATVNTYSGSATYGDLVTFSINKDEQTYELYNETTNVTENGSYDIIDEADFLDIYAVQANGEHFFAIELDDKIITANFPSGNSSNDLSFGVSSEIDNSSRLDEIAGDYIYIRLGDVSINGSTDFKEYGVFTLENDGDMFLIDFATGGTGEYDTYDITELAALGLQFPIDETYDYYIPGTWELNGSKSDRFDVVLGETQATGYAYATGATTVFIMDLGEGNGSAIAYKVTNPSLSSIAGVYKFIYTDADGTKGAGAYEISSDGTIDYVSTTDLETIDSGTFGPIERVDEITNAFVATIDENTYITLIIAGDAIMHFLTDSEGRLLSYGAGAKL